MLPERLACPATMCPLFAPGGSPWTGEADVPCQGPACDWWQGGRCAGAAAAAEQVALALHDVPLVQLGLLLGLSRPPAARPRPGTTFDCPRAADCQWQAQTTGLCPPRTALSLGIDPRVCSW